MIKYKIFILFFALLISDRLLSQNISKIYLSGIWINTQKPINVWKFRDDDSVVISYKSGTITSKFSLDSKVSSHETILNIQNTKYIYYYRIFTKSDNEFKLSLFKMFKYYDPKVDKFIHNAEWGEQKFNYSPVILKRKKI